MYPKIRHNQASDRNVNTSHIDTRHSSELKPVWTSKAPAMKGMAVRKRKCLLGPGPEEFHVFKGGTEIQNVKY